MTLVWGSDIVDLKSSTNESDLQIYRSQNEVWFNCSVTCKTINKLIKLIYEVIHDDKISAYKTDEKIKIILHIDSCGGYIKDLLKFIDFIKQLQSKGVHFVSIINGRVYSAGTLMALVCDEKLMTANSHAMIHELSSIVCGEWTKIESTVKHLKHTHETLVNLYIKYANKTLVKQDLENLLQKETWFNSQEYLEYGLVDKIV